MYIDVQCSEVEGWSIYIHMYLSQSIIGYPSILYLRCAVESRCERKDGDEIEGPILETAARIHLEDRYRLRCHCHHDTPATPVHLSRQSDEEMRIEEEEGRRSLSD